MADHFSAHIHVSWLRQFTTLDQKEITVQYAPTSISLVASLALGHRHLGSSKRFKEGTCWLIQSVQMVTETRLKSGSWHQGKSHLVGNIWDKGRRRTTPPRPRPPPKLPSANLQANRYWVAAKVLVVSSDSKTETCFRACPVLPTNRRDKRREGRWLPGWGGTQGQGVFILFLIVGPFILICVRANLWCFFVKSHNLSAL